MPVGHPSSWVVLSDIAARVVLNPKTKRQSGRPMKARHASSSEKTTTQLCRRCGQPGHNSRRCSNPPMVNEGPRTIVPDEYRRKCSICQTIGHNKQTCPQKDTLVEWMEPIKHNKAVQEEDELPPKKLVIEKHVSNLMSSNIVQTLGTMLDTIVLWDPWFLCFYVELFCFIFCYSVHNSLYYLWISMYELCVELFIAHT